MVPLLMDLFSLLCDRFFLVMFIRISSCRFRFIDGFRVYGHRGFVMVGQTMSLNRLPGRVGSSTSLNPRRAGRYTVSRRMIGKRGLRADIKRIRMRTGFWIITARGYRARKILVGSVVVSIPVLVFVLIQAVKKAAVTVVFVLFHFE